MAFTNLLFRLDLHRYHADVLAMAEAAQPPRWTKNLWHGLLGLTSISVAAFIYTVFMIAPMEEQMGIVQKIFYLHVPSAYGMYVGWTFAAIGGLLYLVKRQDRFDALAAAGAEVGSLFCFIVLVTGPLWGRKAWGTYWVWDPRLTSTLLAGMVYVAYLSLRGFGNPGETEKRFAATLALIGFPLMFLIKFSVQAWSGQHPVVISANGGGISPDMVPVLLLGFVAISLIAAALLWARYGAERARQRVRALEMIAAERDLLEQL